MKCRNIFWLSLVCGMALACSPVLAQGPQHDAPPPPHLAADQRDAQRTISGPYRLTYTLTELDGSRKVGSQRYSFVLDADAPPATLKLGTKVPIAITENLNPSSPTPMSYIDVGMNYQCQLRQFANGMELRSHIVQSAIDTQQANAKNPVIRQSDLQSSVLLQESKPVIVGTVDLPGTTHVLEIQVELTKIP